MIRIDDGVVEMNGDHEEIFFDLCAFYASVARVEELRKINDAAIEAMKKAADDGSIFKATRVIKNSFDN